MGNELEFYFVSISNIAVDLECCSALGQSFLRLQQYNQPGTGYVFQMLKINETGTDIRQINALLHHAKHNWKAV